MSRFFPKLISRIKMRFTGYYECRGVFCILDKQGQAVDGVFVCYRIGAGEWVSCGNSHKSSDIWSVKGMDAARPNYIQPFPIFYRIGEPVSWKFYKPGFGEAVVTRYTAGIVDDKPQVVTLRSQELFSNVMGK